MGQPAAAFGDAAAHGGIIVVGSPSVFIGGRPAARVSDSVACPIHGTGVIAKGSTSVFINGLPAARMGDITGCLVAGVPAVIGAEPVISHRSLATDNKQTVADFEKDGGELLAYGEHKQTDANQDGVLDTHDYAAGLMRMKTVQAPVRVGANEISGETEYGVANVTAHTSKPILTRSLYSEDVSMEVSGIKAVTSATLADAGSGGLNPATKVEATGQVAHGEIKRKIFMGSDAQNTGLILEGAAKYEQAKGEIALTQTSPSLKGYNVQLIRKGSAEAGAVGVAGGLKLYWSKVESRLHVGLDIGLKVLFGLEGSFEVTVGEEYKKEAPPAAPATPSSAANPPGFGTMGIPGTILLGNLRVYIG